MKWKVEGYPNRKREVGRLHIRQLHSQSTLLALKEFLSKTAIEPKGKVTFVKPLLVCEVVYQSVTSDGSLRAPRFQQIRFDKKPIECYIDQILETTLTPR